MNELIGVLVASLFLGVFLGMMALGFTIAFTVSQVFNFAVGQFVILAGLLTVSVQFTGSALANVVIAVVLVSLMGAGIYLFAIRWPESRGAKPLTLVMITFGIGMVTEQLAEERWGSFSLSPPTLLSGHFSIDRIFVPYQGLLFVGVSLLVVVGLWLGQLHTNPGKQLLALGTDRLSARYYGIDDRLMVTLAWTLSFAVLAIAGVLYLPLTGVSMPSDLTYGIDAFTAAVIGGLGNPLAALGGGLVVALTINLVGTYLTATLTDLVTFAFLFAFLVLRPGGLFGNAREFFIARA